MWLAAGAALAIHLLVSFGIPSSQLPLTTLDPNQPAATDVELVGSLEEAAESPQPPTPPEPPPKPEPVPPPKPEPDPVPLPEPAPKPLEQPPPPTPKPKPQPTPEKKSSSPATKPAAASASRAGAAPGTAGGSGDGKDSRPSYLEKPAPKYPAESVAAREHGKVELSVEISATGRPESVKLEKSSGYERLDRAAIEAVRRWRFNPAIRNGQPVPTRVNIPVLFKLP
jgi:protein TonB